MLKPIVIEGTNLPDVWYQTLYKAVEVGRDFKIDRGSFAGQKRKEFDFITIHAKCPGVGELLPKLNPALNLDDPCAQDFLDEYLPYLMTGEEKEGEAYTYGQRICKAKIQYKEAEKYEKLLIPEFNLLEPLKQIKEYSIGWGNESVYLIDQMELMIWTYKNKGYRNNQMILQVGEPSDMVLADPPCLRHIDTRIQNNEEKEFVNLEKLFISLTNRDLPCNCALPLAKKLVTKVLQEGDRYSLEGVNTFLKKCKVYELHFYPYFRSWDLWGGFPANLAAIEMMKQYCAEQIGVENGEIIATSKGLHLYNYVWEIAEAVRGRTVEEFKSQIRIDQKESI